MRAVIQRVSSAHVSVNGEVIGEIDSGLLVLLGIARNDITEDGIWLARKIAELRIFGDSEGRMNRSVRDTGGQALIISQFTLIASTRKGTRPSFNDAASPEIAIPLYEDFVNQLEAKLGNPVQAGRFGANMKVHLVNDGPVTLVIDSARKE